MVVSWPEGVVDTRDAQRQDERELEWYPDRCRCCVDHAVGEAAEWADSPQGILPCFVENSCAVEAAARTGTPPGARSETV